MEERQPKSVTVIYHDGSRDTFGQGEFLLFGWHEHPLPLPIIGVRIVSSLLIDSPNHFEAICKAMQIVSQNMAKSYEDHRRRQASKN